MDFTIPDFVVVSVFYGRDLNMQIIRFPGESVAIDA